MRGPFAILFFMLAACGASGPPPSAALVVDEIEETPCGERTCIAVVVTNHGPKAGSGRCTLSGVGRNYKGNGIEGPTLEVPSLQPQQSKRFMRSIELTKGQRERLLQWSSSCTPGPEG